MHDRQIHDAMASDIGDQNVGPPRLDESRLRFSNRHESPALEAKVDVGPAMSRETSDQMRQPAEMGSVFDQARPMVRQEDRHLQRRHDRRSGWLRKLAIVFAVLALLAVVVLFVVVPFLHDEYGLLVGSEASALIR